ncbi:MAG: copper resistance protein NlpE [Flavobacteriaceae bacterium]|jgi:uncharacterized lipoprotein NlpE involved in copper resistance|nr:copper resistance protein NlpE [Flavobacteriaceae bacterium]
MKRTTLTTLLLAIAVLTISCDKKATQETNATADSTAVQADSTVQTSTAVADLTQIEGAYKGTIPCADCEGIKTELTLNADQTYTLSETYLGGKSDGKPLESKGKYTFDAATQKIVLDNADKTEYKADGGKLIRLDTDGNEITGQNAAYYILSK